MAHPVEARLNHKQNAVPAECMVYVYVWHVAIMSCINPLMDYAIQNM
jgi:hypothetical protein